MNDKKALEIFEACVNEMYKNSTPPTTWKDIKEKYGGKERSEFYMKHSITEDKYNKIKAKYEKKLPVYYKRKLSWFLLDYSPTGKELKRKDA